MKPLLKAPRYKVEPTAPIYLGSGINTYGTSFNIKESEARDSRNTSSRLYPALSVRPGMDDAFAAITTPNALGQRNNQYPHVLDGTVWKAWDGTAWANVQTTLTSATGKFVEFATGTTLYTILANGTDVYSWDGATAASIADAPKTKLYAVHKGRVYALLGKELKFSALNLITDWTTVLDAGSISITNAKGDGTAITEFDDQIYIWTAQSFHNLYGTGPLNYTLSDISDDGCLSERSVIEGKYNNAKALYFMDYGWVKAFTGSTPTRVSHAVKTFIDGINLTYKEKVCAGKNGKYLYWAIPYGATENNIVLELDTDLNIWNVHSLAISQFVTIGEKCYGISPTGTIYDMENGLTDNGTAIAWYHTTGALNRNNLKTKTIGSIPIVFDLPVGSTMTLSVSKTVDSNDFVLVHTFTASASEQRVDVYLDEIANCEWYRLKFAGTGPATIFYIGDDLRLEM
jgi:hypothetical protein